MKLAKDTYKLNSSKEVGKSEHSEFSEDEKEKVLKTINNLIETLTEIKKNVSMGGNFNSHDLPTLLSYSVCKVGKSYNIIYKDMLTNFIESVREVFNTLEKVLNNEIYLDIFFCLKENDVIYQRAIHKLNRAKQWLQIQRAFSILESKGYLFELVGKDKLRYIKEIRAFAPLVDKFRHSQRNTSDRPKKTSFDRIKWFGKTQKAERFLDVFGDQLLEYSKHPEKLKKWRDELHKTHRALKEEAKAEERKKFKEEANKFVYAFKKENEKNSLKKITQNYKEKIKEIKNSDRKQEEKNELIKVLNERLKQFQKEFEELKNKISNIPEFSEIKNSTYEELKDLGILDKLYEKYKVGYTSIKRFKILSGD